MENDRGRALRWTRAGSAVGATIIGLCATLVVVAAGPADTREYGVRAALTGQTTLEKNHFSYALAGGATISDSIIVSNFTDGPLIFHVYGADLVTAQGGGLAPAQEGTPAQVVGPWIHVESAQLTVPAHQELSDVFTVTVPASEQPGDYLGAVVVAKQATSSAGINVLTRAALIAKVTVPGVVQLGVAPGQLEATQQGDDEVFSLPITNTGNVLFTFTAEVTVRDPDGRPIVTLPVSPQGIYVIPGGTATVKATWHGLPIRADVTAVATVHASLNGQPAGTFTSNTLHLTFFSWSLAVWAGAIAAALVLVVRFAVFAAHRRSRLACSHCQEDHARRTLVDVTDAAEVSACSRCQRVIHLAKRATLCKKCLKQHLLQQVVSRPDLRLELHRSLNQPAQTPRR